MYYYNQHTLRQYLEQFIAPRHHTTFRLAERLLFTPIENSRPHVIPILNPEKFITEFGKPSRKLARKFNEGKHRKPRLLFQPDKDLDDTVDRISMWLYRYTGMLGKNYSGTVRTQSLRRAKTFKTIPPIIQIIESQGALLTLDEVELAMSTRLISTDERKKNIEFCTSLSNRHQVVRIQTRAGMINAGRAAENCLGSNIYPFEHDTHKDRVNQKERYHYYQITDADNKPVVTIIVDFQKAHVARSGNGNEYIEEEYWPLIDEFENWFLEKNPNFNKNRPYGAQLCIGLDGDYGL